MLISEEELARFGRGLNTNGSPAVAGRRELRLLLALDREGPAFSGPTKKPDTVRLAGPKDEAACLELWLQDLRAHAEHIAPIDEDKVMANIQVGTRRRGGYTAVIDDKDGKPVALLVLHPLQWHWSQGWFMQEMVNYVAPDHRRSRHAADLIDFAKWVSDEHSRHAGFKLYLLCGVLGTWRIRAKAALYRRRVQMAGVCCIYPSPPVKGD